MAVMVPSNVLIENLVSPSANISIINNNSIWMMENNIISPNYPRAEQRFSNLNNSRNNISNDVILMNRLPSTTTFHPINFPKDVLDTTFHNIADTTTVFYDNTSRVNNSHVSNSTSRVNNSHVSNSTGRVNNSHVSNSTSGGVTYFPYHMLGFTAACAFIIAILGTGGEYIIYYIFCFLLYLIKSQTFLLPLPLL